MGTNFEDYNPALGSGFKMRSENVQFFHRQTFRADNNLDMTDSNEVGLTVPDDSLPLDYGADSAVVDKVYLIEETAVVSSSNTPVVELTDGGGGSVGLAASTGTAGTAGLVHTDEIDDTVATPIDLMTNSLVAAVDTVANGSAQGQVTVAVDVIYKG